jgi:hypothetical protein
MGEILRIYGRFGKSALPLVGIKRPPREADAKLRLLF